VEVCSVTYTVLLFKNLLNSNKLSFGCVVCVFRCVPIPHDEVIYRGCT
jgi:hypothetical protein